MKRYSDNYDELRKETSRLPVIPLKYLEHHKGVPNEIVVDKNTETMYVVDDDYDLLPLGKNVNVIKKYVKIDYDTTLVPIGETLKKGDSISVTENGINIAENLVFTLNETSIKAEGDYVWQGGFEEIIFCFTIIRNQEKVDTNTEPEELVLPEFGEAGQVLIKTDSGIAWADLDITQAQYETIVANTLGEEFIQDEETESVVNASIATPNTFPSNGTIGQVLVRTAEGMGWVDADITKEQYEDIVTNTLGEKYIVNLEGGLLYDSIDSVEIPNGIPFNGQPGQILFKTESWVEWQDVELNQIQYRRIISNTLGDNFIV